MRRLWRVIAARRFLSIGLLCGMVAYLLLPSSIDNTTRSIMAWDFAVIVYLGLAAHLFASEHLDRMAADAAAQQEGEWTIFWLTLAAITFSFVAIIGEFAGIARDMPSGPRNLHLLLVAITLFVSWLMTHTTFAFRYAHEFYQIDPGGSGISGGLEFPGEKRPDYLDFMYFALVLGMTFQVSDVQITARKFRRLAAAHGLLGFLYNAIIVALTVNLAAGLL
jgi:uncharacterized membrane protein